MYLNEIYMGRGCAGVACAAPAYFGKDVWSLDQAETCLLVGLIQSPEHYNPATNWEGLKLRQETVINVLAEQGLVDPAQVQVLKNQPITIVPATTRQTPHPYLVNYIVGKMEEMLGKEQLYQGGCRSTPPSIALCKTRRKLRWLIICAISVGEELWPGMGP